MKHIKKIILPLSPVWTGEMDAAPGKVRKGEIYHFRLEEHPAFDYERTVELWVEDKTGIFRKGLERIAKMSIVGVNYLVQRQERYCTAFTIGTFRIERTYRGK